MRLRRVAALALAVGFSLSLSVLALRPRIVDAAASRPAVDVTRVTLPNGLRVVVLRDPLAPVVSTYMNYEVGSDDESITGLAHAQEHMMFRGSKSLSASQFAEVTAATGGSFDADTQNNVTQFYFTMPSSDLDLALHLDASRAQGLLDSQQLWNQERGAIEQEVSRDNSDASYRLYVKALQHVMSGTPYSDAGLGTLDSFGHEVQAPQLQAFYKTWYHPNNAVYVIAGDVDPQATIAKVRRLFGAIPARAVPAPKPVHLAALTPATFTDSSDDPLTQAFLAYRFPGYDSPDYAASQILIDALNSQRGALYGLVAAGKAVDASAQAQTFTQAGMALIGTSVTADVSPANELADIRAVVAGYRETGIPDDLVQSAKLEEIASAESARSSISDLAAEWSQALAVEHRTPDDDLAAIERVTTADVNRVLNRYLVDATATSAYAVPKNAGSVQGGSAAVATGLAGTTENNTVIPAPNTPLPPWAKSLFARLRVPDQTLHPVTSVLPNGITLVVQPESVSDSVVVAGTIRNDPGLEEAPGTEGVASLTSALLPFGTTTYDRVAYQREIDKIAADVSTGTTFSLSVLAPQFDRGVQLLADDELHPSFPDGAFDIIKSQTSRAVEGEQQSPDHLASVSLENALYPSGDPARRIATPQSVQKLTLGDVKTWFATAYRPDLTTIVVVGHVTPASARAVVEKWFGGWKADGAPPDVDPSPVPDNAPASAAIPATGRIQSSVRLAETLQLRRGDPDVAPLRVANAALSGGFYASLLFHDLREVNGLVYSVESAVNVGKTRSIFEVAYGCAPENVDKAETLAVADLRRLQTSPLSADRLTTAKSLLIGSLPLREQSYDGIASELLGYASQGLPLDQNLVQARAELAATPADIEAAMKKWIRPDDFVRVVEGPAQR